jgi:hypothetical protein
MFHDALQLRDITRPGVVGQGHHGPVAHSDRQARGTQDVLDEFGDVLAPLPQRRHLQDEIADQVGRPVAVFRRTACARHQNERGPWRPAEQIRQPAVGAFIEKLKVRDGDGNAVVGEQPREFRQPGRPAVDLGQATGIDGQRGIRTAETVDPAGRDQPPGTGLAFEQDPRRRASHHVRELPLELHRRAALLGCGGYLAPSPGGG